MGAALRAILAFCRGLGREVTATLSSVTGAEVGDTLAWFGQHRPWQTQHPLPVPQGRTCSGGALLFPFSADREWDELFSERLDERLESVVTHTPVAA